MNATEKFVSAAVLAIADTLRSDEACHRLGLTRDIVNGWRGFVADKSPAEMASLVATVAADNKVPLREFEDDTSIGASERAQKAAEMVLGVVDAFYRRFLTKPN